MKNNEMKAISWIGKVHLIIAMCILTVCPIFGQTVSKKSLMPEDFDQWSSQHSYSLSPKGDWISWIEDYEIDADTLKLLSTNTKKEFAFPNGENGTFGNAGKWFAAMGAENTAILLDLQKGSIFRYINIHSFHFTENGKFIALYKVSGEEKSLIVKNLENNREVEMAAVAEYAFNKNGDSLAFITNTVEKGSVNIMNTKDFKIHTLFSSQSNFKDLVWNPQGNGILFMEDPNNENSANALLHYFNFNCSQVSTSLNTKHANFPKDQKFAPIEPFFSRDGTKVFFYSNSPPIASKTDVEVWSATDAVIYPRKNADWLANPFLLNQWDPAKDKILEIGTGDFPEVVLTGDHKNAIVYNPWAYEPQEKRSGNIDLYLVNLEKGERKPLLKAQESYYRSFVVSPSGNYTAYFRDGNWWSYTIGTDTKVNLTESLKVPFDKQDEHFDGESSHFGFGGWLNDDSSFIVRDSFYDYWLLRPDTGKSERITFGIEKGMRFEVVEDMYGSYPKMRTPQFESMAIDGTEGLIFIGRGKNNTEGLYFWKEKFPLRTMYEDTRHISEVRKARDKDLFSFTTETFATPPRLEVVEGKKLKTINQTNPQAAYYGIEKMEVIKYKGINDSLKGLLFYPQNYVDGKKHPMIVHIYERQSGHSNEYINPSLYSGQGFNPKVYTNAGYFVLLPDIDYEIGNPGYSALECVTNGVEKVLLNKSIDRNRLGLIGHSFGGYETSFIVTQSQMFAAAVSGAGIHDLRRDYFSIDPLTFIQNKWMYETYQLRFGKPYFEIRDSYLKNCPLHNAASVNTPLLLWTGQRDVRIDYGQSVEMYLALKGLGKNVELLVYPEEGHALWTKSNQRDLTERIKKWFDEYL
ncbi:S9 family peptidase [Aequorivita antarctica]|uniref:S9 family peptidase n=2 Tax=Aequorivita antarctica TaxID=153266 RepID=A0A5C6Z027_9FLAO|nr:prolyl oligopeptidase family serine peptidase [Aequorivita antarctica]TXD72731.1 S9 family peptidase [Aequorivita antarctica]